jgi:hydroxymethylglutaryl-CoA lyase
VRRYVDAGLTAISLADSSGHADPDQVEAMVTAVRGIGPTVDITCHFHNTYGMGLANVYAAYRAGVRSFETGFGGLGGCPFVAMAADNVCTEDVVHMFQRANLRRDIELDAITAVTKDAALFFNKALPGTIHRTGPIFHRGRFAAPTNG